MVAWLGVRRHAILHVVILALPLLVLPIDVATESAPSENTSPFVWVLALAVAGCRKYPELGSDIHVKREAGQARVRKYPLESQTFHEAVAEKAQAVMG